MWFLFYIMHIYILNQTNLVHNQTYYNQLKLYVSSLKDIQEVKNIKYGCELTGEYLEAYYMIMEQSKKIISSYLNVDDQYVNNLVDTLSV